MGKKKNECKKEHLNDDNLQHNEQENYEQGDNLEQNNCCGQEEQSENQNDEMNKLRQQLDVKDKECKENMDKFQRIAAEYANYKTRTTKEKQCIYSDSVVDVVGQMLPVLDDLERAVESCGQDAQSTALLEGVEMVLKNFKDVLCKLEVKEIKTNGECFNPELHDAVMHIKDESFGENVIVEEFQKGYKVKDKVIRYSMVKVAN